MPMVSTVWADVKLFGDAPGPPWSPPGGAGSPASAQGEIVKFRVGG